MYTTLIEDRLAVEAPQIDHPDIPIMAYKIVQTMPNT